MLGDGYLSTGVIASMIAAAVSSAGLLSMVALGDWGRRNSAYFSAFAIGVLSVAVTFHLAPEAVEHADGSFAPLLASFAVMALAGLVMRLFSRDPGQSEGDGGGADSNAVAFGFASIFALGFHSFLDGVVYDSTFRLDVYTGWIATLGLLLHEFPEGVIAYYLMRRAQLGVTSAAALAFVASSLTTIIGALTSSFLVANLEALPIGALMGASTGALVYIIIFHLGPHALYSPKGRAFLFVGFGVVVATLAEMLRHSQH